MSILCDGKMVNGFDKKFTICSKCSRIDYEQNEGDICNENVWNNYIPKHIEIIERNMFVFKSQINNKDFEGIVDRTDSIIESFEKLRAIFNDEDFYKD